MKLDSLVKQVEKAQNTPDAPRHALVAIACSLPDFAQLISDFISTIKETNTLLKDTNKTLTRLADTQQGILDRTPKIEVP